MFNDAKNILALDKMFYCVLQMHKQRVLTGIQCSVEYDNIYIVKRLHLVKSDIYNSTLFNSDPFIQNKQTVDNCIGPHK